MIAVTIYRKQGRVTGFECIGHSGYAASGKDIVCAGVSTLVINTVNSIEAFTSAEYKLDAEEAGGRIALSFTKEADHDAELLVNAMLLGLEDIRSNYGKQYLNLNYKEV